MEHEMNKDMSYGEITSMSICKDGVEVRVAHGKKKPQTMYEKNAVVVHDYDDRPKSFVLLKPAQAEGLSIGDKVIVAVAKINTEVEDENA